LSKKEDGDMLSKKKPCDQNLVTNDFDQLNEHPSISIIIAE